ncbi:MAG: amidase [Mycobacteriales bacterium]|nr:amidase [Mycobacteriales bacterium]
MASLVETAELVRRGGASPLELVTAAVRRCSADDLGAVVHVAAERALAEATGSLPDGPLRGVPVLVKDIVDVTGEVTRCGSLTTTSDAPARADAAVVRALRAAGAVVVGRTRTHEHAWGLTTQHEVLGGTANPVDPARVPGGSSGGSAVAVATGLVPLALGTDTACSLRLPAAWCGVVGHKPTHGLVDATGVSELAASLDHVGALTADVADARLALSVLAGLTLPVTRRDLRGLRVGLPTGPDLPLSADVAAVLAALVDRVTDAGAEVVEVTAPPAAQQWDCFVAVQAVEALAHHRARGWWPDRASAYGSDVRGRLERAVGVTADQAAQARQAREAIRAQVDAVFDDIDVLLSPVAGSGPSLRADPDHVLLDGARVELRSVVLPHTVLADLCGLPACAVPAGVDRDGLPVGVQVTGPRGADAVVLDVAALL